LNYDTKHKPEIEGIEIKLKVPQQRRVKAVDLLSPDEDREQVLPYDMSNQTITIKIPRLRIYDLVRVILT